MNQEDVNEFAKQQGYDRAEYLCEWRGFHCYEPLINGDGPAYIGLPLIILVDQEGKIRMSTSQEAMQQIRETNP